MSPDDVTQQFDREFERLTVQFQQYSMECTAKFARAEITLEEKAQLEREGSNRFMTEVAALRAWFDAEWLKAIRPAGRA